MMLMTAGGFSSYQWRQRAANGRTTPTAQRRPPLLGETGPAGQSVQRLYFSRWSNWKHIDSIDVPMAKKLYVGLVVSSHNNIVLNSVMFDNVSLSK